MKASNARYMPMSTMAYAGIIGKSKDITNNTFTHSPLGSGDDLPKTRYMETELEDSSILEPGETLVLAEFFDADGDDLDNCPPPVVTYKDESIYGSFPKEMQKKSKVTSSDIEVPKKEESLDTTVKLELNSNVLTSISAYSQNTLIKTLEKDVDYKFTKRDEVVLSKSFLDSLQDEVTTLEFTFSNGMNDIIHVNNSYLHENLETGTFSISDRESTAFYKGRGSKCTWEDLVVPIYLSNLEDEKITSGNLTLNYNTHCFENAEIDLYDDTINVAVNPDLGNINITLNSDSMPIDDKHPLFYLTLTPYKNYCPENFDVPEYSKLQKLSLSEDSYYVTEDGTKYRPSNNFNYFNLKNTKGTHEISSEKAVVKQGETITIPVSLKNSKYYNILSFVMMFSYDKDIFESINVNQGSILDRTHYIFGASKNTDAGRITFMYNDKDKDLKYRITEDGNLMNIVLKVKDDAPLGETSLTKVFYTINALEHNTDNSYGTYCNLNLSPITIEAK